MRRRRLEVSNASNGPQSGHFQIAHAEILARIAPDVGQFEAGSLRQLAEAAERVLVGILRADRFAGGEVELLAGNVRGLVVLADEVHLNPSVGRIVEGSVRESLDSEVTPKLAIDPDQDV